jgi:hypothetical protein
LWCVHKALSICEKNLTSKVSIKGEKSVSGKTSLAGGKL